MQPGTTALLAPAFCFANLRAAQGSTADGALGNQSTGTVDLTIIKGDMVAAGGFASFSFPAYIVGGGDLSANQSVCIYTSDPAGDYRVTAMTASGPGLGGELRLANGSGGFVHYQAGWTDSAGGTMATSTAQAGGGPFGGHNIASAPQLNADTVAGGCGGGSNATLSILIPEGGAYGLMAAPDGTYSDVLSVVIDPD